MTPSKVFIDKKNIKGGRMERNTQVRTGRKWIQLSMVILITIGLLITGACSKKKIRTDHPSVQRSGDQAATDAGKSGAEQGGIDQEALGSGSDVSEKGLSEDKSRALGAEETSAARTARERFENDDVYFEYDSSALLSEAQSILMEKSEWLRNNPQASIVIEGHTDERGTIEYNLALGDRRAESVRSFIMELGVDISRIRTVSYGEERPVDPSSDESAWARNRRAHFFIEQ